MRPDKEALQTHKSILHSAALWRTDGRKQDKSNFDVPASAEVDAMSESQFVAKLAA
jgi:hypothetical protein